MTDNQAQQQPSLPDPQPQAPSPSDSHAVSNFVGERLAQMREQFAEDQQRAAQERLEAMEEGEGSNTEGEGAEEQGGGEDAGSTEAASKQDAATATPSEAPAEPDAPKATAWAAFRHQQQQHVRRQEALAQEREAFNKERDEIKTQLQQLEHFKARAKEDPFEALKFIGYEDGKEFLNWVAENGMQMPAERKELNELKRQVEESRREREQAIQQAQQQRQEQEIKQNIDAAHQQIATFIKETPEFSESLVAFPGTEQAVFQVMKQHYQQSGEEMPTGEAVKQVEQRQEQQIKQLLDELVSNKRGLAMFNELATKLNTPAQARKQAPQGINQRVANNVGASGKGKISSGSFEDRLAAAKARMDAKWS